MFYHFTSDKNARWYQKVGPVKRLTACKTDEGPIPPPPPTPPPSTPPPIWESFNILRATLLTLGGVTKTPLQPQPFEMSGLLAPRKAACRTHAAVREVLLTRSNLSAEKCSIRWKVPWLWVKKKPKRNGLPWGTGLGEMESTSAIQQKGLHKE